MISRPFFCRYNKYIMKETRKKGRKAPSVQLATLVKEIPQGDDWVFEIKYDGYRLLAVRHPKETKLYTRNGLDWTTKFPKIARDLNELLEPGTILDGEVVAKGPDGKISFSELQRSLNGESKSPLIYFAFDILSLRRKGLQSKPLSERRQALEEIFVSTRSVKLSPLYTRRKLDKLLQKVEKEGLEGIMAKRLSRPYRPGRGDDWVKFKFNKHEEFVIIGYSPHSRESELVGSLLLGLPIDKKNYWYCGKVGTGFSAADRNAFLSKLSRPQGKPFSLLNPELLPRKSVISPSKMICEVEFTEWTPDGLLRHPSFLGLRPDKTTNQLSIKNSSHPFVSR